MQLTAADLAAPCGIGDSRVPSLLRFELLAVPAVDDSITSAETAAASSSPLADPVLIVLACVAVLFFVSWRLSGQKKRD